jgi:ADP-ribose pyrophosphatase
MPKKEKAVKVAATPKAKAAKPKAEKSAQPKAAKVLKPKTAKALHPKAAKVLKPKAKKPPKTLPPEVAEAAQLLSSEVAFEGRVFQVLRDQLIEPGGAEVTREIIRHNGSAVILAVDSAKNKRDPWVVVERQYRHAAQRFLWELPAGKLEPGEDALAGAQRELEEETGYRAKTWKPLVEYYASPGFVGEAMKLFLAEGLVAGDAHPEDDERIELRLVKLSELLKLIEKGAIQDGKTLTGILLYARLIARKFKK